MRLAVMELYAQKAEKRGKKKGEEKPPANRPITGRGR
jgi:hypothetical protein